jgi:hypothetical protein
MRRLYKASFKGEIDYKKLYLKCRTKIIIKAKMTNGLYLVLSVTLKGEKQVTFISIEIDM